MGQWEGLSGPWARWMVERRYALVMLVLMDGTERLDELLSCGRRGLVRACLDGPAAVMSGEMSRLNRCRMDDEGLESAGGSCQMVGGHDRRGEEMACVGGRCLVLGGRHGEERRSYHGSYGPGNRGALLSTRGGDSWMMSMEGVLHLEDEHEERAAAGVMALGHVPSAA